MDNMSLHSNSNNNTLLLMLTTVDGVRASRTTYRTVPVHIQLSVAVAGFLLADGWSLFRLDMLLVHRVWPNSNDNNKPSLLTHTTLLQTPDSRLHTRLVPTKAAAQVPLSVRPSIWTRLPRLFASSSVRLCHPSEETRRETVIGRGGGNFAA